MKWILSLITILFALTANGQESTFINPILPGGYPDPSICRVGDNFYIVNSSFEYFPGLPIHHSKDLINWELIGYGIHNQQQAEGIKLLDIQQRGGIHAPSLRYNEGTYYIITTSVYDSKIHQIPTEMINFVITAKDPHGPWSEPHIIKDAVGIDPDIFFDEDGKVWYVGTCTPGNNFGNGIGEIWTQELDLKNWKLIGERYSIWNGACGGFCAEGPHMYKIKGKYYLMIAEGGTGYNHSAVIAVSDKITGPFTSNPRNPIITSRNLLYSNWTHNTGHADLVKLQDGRWYMVALSSRSDEGNGSNMGRETHLIPVIWERETENWRKIKNIWPICAPKTGKVERINPVPFAGTRQYYNDSFSDNFDSDVLNLEWNFRRYPLEKVYSLSDRSGYLRLYLKPEKFAWRERYSLMGIRQKESDFEYSASMQFNPRKDGAEAGISLFQQDNNYINMTICKDGKEIKLNLAVAENRKPEYIAKSVVLDDYNGDIIFRISSKHNAYSYFYSMDKGKTFTELGTTANDLILCHGYTGAYVGVYATSNGNPTKEYADFDWVFYKGYTRH